MKLCSLAADVSSRGKAGIQMQLAGSTTSLANASVGPRMVYMPDPAPPELPTISPELPDAQIPDDQADAAATELGLTYFKASKARKFKVLGQYFTQLGVIQLGVGRLAASDEAIQRMLMTAVALSEDEDNDPGARVAALTAGRGLVESQMRSVEIMRDLVTGKLIDGPQSNKRRSFVDEKPVVPIQANNCQINIDSSPKPPQTS